jgi:hypothetical protein
MRRMTSLPATALLTLLAPAFLRGADASSKPAGAAAARVERGKYLVTIMGCNDCHTPWKMGPQGVPEPDMTRMLSGHPEAMKLPPPPAPSGPWLASFAATQTAFAGPWGVSYAANLTPDQNTGIGIWTEDLFIKAMRTGKHLGTSRPIQPPMPWYGVAKATDADLKAIFAYVRSIPQIVNHVPDYQEPSAPPKPAPEKKKP